MGNRHKRLRELGRKQRSTQTRRRSEQLFMDLDRSLVLQHNEELMHEARKWHLQRRLRANREHRLGTRPQVDSRRTGTGVIEMKQKGGAHTKLQLRKVRPVRSMKTLALGLLGRRRNSCGSTPR
jgi:hypothetical protein